MPAHGLPRFAVPDAERAAAEVRAHGGTALIEPALPGEWAASAYCEDSLGAAFGLQATSRAL